MMEAQYTAAKRYPQVGERVWLKTNQPPDYEGEAIAEGLMWRVGDDGYRFPIAVDDEYRLLQPYTPPRLTRLFDHTQLTTPA